MPEEKMVTAEELAKEFKAVSVSEFFTRNRHLLGFDNATKALLTVVKEAVDNSLDAAEEARISPDILVDIKEVSEDRFLITVEDNGPGIVKEHIPNVFASLLFGSKFHRLRQSRGVQGIGISASVMYGQLTTGKSAKIISKVKSKKEAQFFELHIDTKNNRPEIVKEEELDWDKPHGTRVEIEIEGKYQKGKQGVDEYLKQTAIVNPHMQLIYNSPKGERVEFPRASNELPKEAKAIKPHPYGVELGILMNMLRDTKAKNLVAFLTNEFSRVSDRVAKEICNKAKIYEKAMPSRIARQEADNLLKAIRSTKIMAPPTNCLSPLSENLILKGLKKEIEADFYASITRPPNVYRGNPFQISAGIAYGGGLQEDDLVRVMRFANRVPLLYQQSACAVTRSVINTAWKNYGLSQSKGAIPSGPAVILVHIASVWVPFTSESKEAIAHYPEIIKEIKLALQECGRKLAGYIRKKRKMEHEQKRKSIFERYVNELVESIDKINKVDKDKLKKDLLVIANKRTLGDYE